MTTPTGRSAFTQNLLAYGASEIGAKVSRLLVVVAIARYLGPAEIGLAAAALAVGDILKSLTQNGAIEKIIAARAAELDAVCQAAYRIFLGWCVGLCALQVALAAIIRAAGGDALLCALIAVLAVEYLFMPGGLVQAGLAKRAGKLKATAAISGGQIVGANLLTALLVVFWPSPFALVLPRVLSAPVWLIGMRRLHPWRPDPSVAAAPAGSFVSFGAAVLGIEILKALRLQADKLVIGALLGAEALGIYFMAFNAGLGLATSFATAFSIVLFPHLCAATDRLGALRDALRLGVGIIAPAVILQSLLAPIYVPILLGPEWSAHAGLVSILCLAAIPGILWSATAGWLRAEGRVSVELTSTAAMTVALIAATAVMAPFGLHHVAAGYLLVATLTQVAAALPALAALFPIRQQKA